MKSGTGKDRDRFNEDVLRLMRRRGLDPARVRQMFEEILRGTKPGNTSAATHQPVEPGLTTEAAKEEIRRLLGD